MSPLHVTSFTEQMNLNGLCVAVLGDYLAAEYKFCVADKEQITKSDALYIP